MDERHADRVGDNGLRPSRRVGGVTAESTVGECDASTAREEHVADGASVEMEEVLRRENLKAAYVRVVRNGGAGGVDGKSVDDLEEQLRTDWPRIREQLLSDTYVPSPVRKVEIPKPGGGVRVLGIPTVVDRMIQQALHQKLTRVFDVTFSDDSYGFRPGRSAHQAVLRSREHIEAGHRWVVDLDLESFFDRVNHDVLMSRVARRVKDKRILHLIGRYLRAGMMEGGLMSPRTEGTPQGGPLSPLLSNILLDELDKELERRGHRFVRYCDDFQVYVKSEAAGVRVKTSLERFLEKRLRLKSKLKTLFRRGRGKSLARTVEELNPILRGWINYYRLAEVKGVFEELDQWIRRRLRLLLWRQWKRPRTRFKRLRQRGLDHDRARRSAYNGLGPWWNSGASHMNQAVPTSAFVRMGLVSLVQQHRKLACNS